MQRPVPAQGASVPEEILFPLRRSEPAGYTTQHAPACSSAVLSRTIMTCMLQPQAACSLALRAQTEPISCHHNTAAVGELAEPQPWPGVSPGIAAEGARLPLTCRQCNGAISPDSHRRQPGPPLHHHTAAPPPCRPGHGRSKQARRGREVGQRGQPAGGHPWAPAGPSAKHCGGSRVACCQACSLLGCCSCALCCTLLATAKPLLSASRPVCSWPLPTARPFCVTYLPCAAEPPAACVF